MMHADRFEQLVGDDYAALYRFALSLRISRGKRQLRRLLQAKDELAAAVAFVSCASR